MTWKVLCEKHDYRRRLSIKEDKLDVPIPQQSLAPPKPLPYTYYQQYGEGPGIQSFAGPVATAPPYERSSRSFDSATNPSMMQRPVIRSHKSYFKQRYLVETAWRTGGRNIARHITQDQGVVTSLHLTPKYIVVALDNAKIHVFDTNGDNQKTLQGHVMGVWAMVPWGNTLVSGGCDRDVRVWDMSTGFVVIISKPMATLIHPAGRAYTLFGGTPLLCDALRCQTQTQLYLARGTLH
jgi:F-box and WD-40 domain protein CDC4